MTSPVNPAPPKAAIERRVAVVGAGWAGLAAAVTACAQGHRVSLFEMAARAGGRAMSAPHGGLWLDNGQHILIGAYRDTLALMRQVGVDPAAVLHRQPLALVRPGGSGLRLPPGRPVAAFARGVLAWRELCLADRLRLLALAARWRMQGFRCDPAWTVADLTRSAPPLARQRLLEPLCVAALNTPAREASAQVFLTVLRDALSHPPSHPPSSAFGSADLLLPKVPLDDLLTTPAVAWLQRHGAQWHPATRVQRLDRATNAAAGWQVDGEAFDHVVLACSATEAARLLENHAPAWAAQAAALRYEPIVTVWLRDNSACWPGDDATCYRPPLPMLSFAATDAAPAQFGFNLGALGGPPGVYALVVSGAGPWAQRGLGACAAAVQKQWQETFCTAQPPECVAVRAQKRATFLCTPGLIRPAAQPLPHLRVAGDYVASPYPATLEGAVRSGAAAVGGL